MHNAPTHSQSTLPDRPAIAATGKARITGGAEFSFHDPDIYVRTDYDRTKLAIHPGAPRLRLDFAPVVSGAVPRVRHGLPSYVLGLDDEPHVPSERLMQIALRAAPRAWETDLSALAARFGDEMRRYANVWPGEPYRLLAGLMDVLKSRLVVEIGTATGASCLTMKAFLPPEGVPPVKLHEFCGDCG